VNTQGPRFLTLTLLDVAGEYVRSNIRDGEAGIEFVLDTQVLDVTTCNPVTNALVEIWRKSMFLLLIIMPPQRSLRPSYPDRPPC
jgi:hypothetical protein